MKNPIKWFEEHGFTSNDKITIADVIALQMDAKKEGLMIAQSMASDVIRREAPKYAQVGQGVPDEMTFSGLQYFVTSAITAEADRLSYLK